MCACACVFVRARVCMSNSQQKSAKLQSTADAIESRTPCRPDAIESRTPCRPALMARFHAHTAAPPLACTHTPPRPTTRGRPHSSLLPTVALAPALAGHWPGTGRALAGHWHWPGTGPALARHWPGPAPLRRFRAQGGRVFVCLVCFLWATEGLPGRVRCVRALGSVRGRWGLFVCCGVYAAGDYYGEYP
jgi:hypothetical protein